MKTYIKLILYGIGDFLNALHSSCRAGSLVAIS